MACLVKGNKIPCHFNLTTYFRKQFPQYGKTETTVMKRQSVFIPKNTCTINICCLAKKGSSTPPNSEQLINLSLADLGKKRVVFSDKNGDHYFFQETLEKNFPKLKRLEGAFALYRAASGGLSCRQLLKI